MKFSHNLVKYTTCPAPSENKKRIRTIVASYPILYVRGGDDGIRTHDPYLAKVMLSQLSYIPTGIRNR